MGIKRIALTCCLLLAAAQPALAEEMTHDHGGGIYHMFRAETDLGADNHHNRLTTWDVKGWVGTDEDKLYLKTEGEKNGTTIETAEFWALYSRNIATFWDAQAGIRYDNKPKSTAYLTLGVNGLAPYYFETEAHLFVSDRGDVSARLREENDLLLTQQLIVQPYVELNAFAQDVRAQQVGTGLADGKLGLQTRYEFTRAFASYVDVHYDRKFGQTADIARRHGEDEDAVIGAIGLRLMF